MNIIENEFLELKQKQVNTLFKVCNYLSDKLNINDFYLYSQGFYLEADIYSEEITVELVIQKEIRTIYSCYGHLNEEVEELKNVIQELIHLLNTMINADSPGVYFLKTNTFEEFSSQFKNV